MVEPTNFQKAKEKAKAEAKKRQEKASIMDDILDGNIPSGLEYENREKAEREVPDLREMNLKYAFVHSVGGKPMIKTMTYNDYYEKKIVEFISPESLYLRYANKPAPERTERGSAVPLGKWWFGHQYRKDYDAITFEPDKPSGEYPVKDGLKLLRGKLRDVSEDVYVIYFNMWEGFAVPSVRGSWKYTKRHIFDILCNKDRHKYKYVIKWFAWTVQNPGKRAEVALIFKGKKGAGKGTILQAFVKLFGRHGMVISNKEQMVGKHNDHLAMTSFLYADEIEIDNDTEGVLKNLITEPSLTTEPKFRGVRTSKNCLHIAMATNADWVIPATEDERRYFVNEVSDTYAEGISPRPVIKAHFKHINDELYEKDNSGLKAMFYDLKNRKLGKWHPRYDVPKTDELRRQIAMSLPKLKYAFMDMLDEGIFPGKLQSGEYRISNGNLLEHLQNKEQGNKSLTGKSLAKLCKDLDIQVYKSGGSRYYTFPQLGKIREIWDLRMNKHSDWRLSEEWHIPKPTEY